METKSSKTGKLFDPKTGLSVYFLDVTPKMAEEMLKKNIGNRDVRRGMVKRFVDEITAGSWLANGQPIHLTRAGIFGNGQHRLQAVIEANQPVRMLVVEGLTEEALDTIDEGSRKTPADRLKWRGVKRDKLVSASINVIRIVTSKRGPISVNGLWNLYLKYKHAFDWALKSVPEGHPATYSAVYGALVFAHTAEPTKTAMFFHDAVNSSKLREDDSPVRQFLQVIENIQFEKNDYNTRIQTFRRVCHAIQCYCTGHRVKRLSGHKEAVDFFVRDSKQAEAKAS